jgi:inner membrane transporter RhtA
VSNLSAPPHANHETFAAPGSPRPEGAVARVVGALPPPGLLLVSIVSIQLGAAVAVNLFPALGPIGTVFLRIAFSALLLLLAARSALSWSSARPHIGNLLLFGFILGATNLCFYGAIARIPLGVAVAIEFVGPLGVAVATSRRWRDFAWIALAAVGIALLTPEIGSALDPLGVALAGVAGVGWAGFVLMSRRIGTVLPGNSGLAIGMLIATGLIAPVELVAGGVTHLDAGLLAGALAVAILSTAVPLSLEYEALKRMTPRAYGILVTLEPVVAALVGAVALGQALAANAILAIACVTAAALGVTVTDRRVT